MDPRQPAPTYQDIVNQIIEEKLRFKKASKSDEKKEIAIEIARLHRKSLDLSPSWGSTKTQTACAQEWGLKAAELGDPLNMWFYALNKLNDLDNTDDVVTAIHWLEKSYFLWEKLSDRNDVDTKLIRLYEQLANKPSIQTAAAAALGRIYLGIDNTAANNYKVACDWLNKTKYCELLHTTTVDYEKEQLPLILRKTLLLKELAEEKEAAHELNILENTVTPCYEVRIHKELFPALNKLYGLEEKTDLPKAIKLLESDHNSKFENIREKVNAYARFYLAIAHWKNQQAEKATHTLKTLLTPLYYHRLSYLAREDVLSTILQVEKEKSFSLLQQQYESEMEITISNENLLNELFEKLAGISVKNTAELLKNCASASYNRSFNRKQIPLEQLKKIQLRAQENNLQLVKYIHFLLAQCYESYGDQQNLLLAMQHLEKTDSPYKDANLRRIYGKSAKLFVASAKGNDEKMEAAIEYYKKAGDLGDSEALLIAAEHSKQEEKHDIYAQAIRTSISSKNPKKIKSALTDAFTFINKYSSNEQIDSSISLAYNSMQDEADAASLWETLKKNIRSTECPISFKYMDNILSQLYRWYCTEMAFLEYAHEYYNDQTTRHNESSANEIQQRVSRYTLDIEICKKIKTIFEESVVNKKNAALEMIKLINKPTKDANIKFIVAKKTKEFIDRSRNEEEILTLFARENQFFAIYFLFEYYMDPENGFLFKTYTSRSLYLAAKMCLLTLNLEEAAERFALPIAWLKNVEKEAHKFLSENTSKEEKTEFIEKSQARQYEQLKDKKPVKLNKYQLQVKYYLTLIREQNKKNVDDPDELFLQNLDPRVDIKKIMAKVLGKDWVKEKEKYLPRQPKINYTSTANRFTFLGGSAHVAANGEEKAGSNVKKAKKLGAFV